VIARAALVPPPCFIRLEKVGGRRVTRIHVGWITMRDVCVLEILIDSRRANYVP